jgi:hypothetical protein
MNERIQELAKQTGYIWHASGDPQIYEFTPEKLEKFGELIMAECLEIVEDEDDGSQDTIAVRWAMHRIKKHFGVE